MKKSNSVKHVAAVAAIVLAATSTAVLAGQSKTDDGAINASVADYLSISASDATFANAVVPGTPETASSTASVTTNAQGGYVMGISGTSLTHEDTTTTIPNTLPAWDASAPNAVAYTTQEGLAFSAGDTGTDFASLPASAETIVTENSYAAGAQETPITFKLNVLPTQKGGAYSGTYTITVTTAGL